MDIFRRFVTDAPAFESFRDVKPTLLVCWWCTFYSLAVIVIRTCGRYIRAEKVFIEDGIMMLAIIPLFVRMGFVHVVLLFGTNNVQTAGLLAGQIHRREIGSKIVLLSRITYTVYLWTIKYSFSVFLRTLTESVWQRSHQRMLFYLHIFLGATFVACIISDLAPCQPFSHYWQVVPDPGSQCRQGYAYLLTNGILNIVTNVVLVIFPIPMILHSSLPRKQKFAILLRMALPLLNIAMTAYQIPHILAHAGAQPIRSLLASLDILLVTFTSNSVVLVSLLQDRGYKKSKYKHVRELPLASRNLRSSAGTVRGRRDWESDEELMGREMELKTIEGMTVVAEKKKDRGGSVVGEEMGRAFKFNTTIPLIPLPVAKVREVQQQELQELQQDIRVATTWEIVSEPNVRKGETFLDDR